MEILDKAKVKKVTNHCCLPANRTSNARGSPSVSPRKDRKGLELTNELHLLTAS